MLADLFNSHYYKFFDTAKNFSDAAAHAATLSIKGMPGHLVTLNFYDELAFIWSVYPNKTAWVGLSDSQKEGTFVYVGGPESGQVATNIFPSSNTASNTLKWSDGNPDNWQGAENCVEIWSGSSQFNDALCSNTRSYFVEFDCPGVLIPSAQSGCTRMILLECFYVKVLLLC